VFSLRKIIRGGIESLLWLFSSFLANLISYDGLIPKESYKEVVFLGILGSVIYVFTNMLFAVYKTQLIKASFEELIRIGISIFFTTITLFCIRILGDFQDIPRFVPLLSGIISIVLQTGLRILVSGKLNSKLFQNATGVKTLIYGSGITGQQIIDQMLYQKKAYDPIGFLDDNYNKSNFIYRGRKVLGTISSLEEVVRTKKPEILIIAIASISSANLISLEQRCKDLEISIRIIPSAIEILKKNLKLSDISNLSIDKILGRQQITCDSKDIESFFQNKRILITGAGGSIGSEIARQISCMSISSLSLVDRNENSLLELCLSINNDGLFNNENIILCDIRDSIALSKIIRNLKPDVVFHAAALKHLVLLEKFPDEAFKTNVLATRNLIDSCIENDVKYFVNISTDKAADPISQLGKSKYLSEQLISGVAGNDRKYISVRFGNVVGSNGSFLNTFRRQIENGGPITVTHKDVSRYFMTIEEAVYLVLKSIIVGKCGETLILDMGEPVKINDVAHKMIADSGKDIEIEYTGLRPGEKLNEVLIGQSETTYIGENQHIVHTKVPALTNNLI